MTDIVSIISGELGKSPEHIKNVITLIDEGNSIPFIARYRKELHGSMDDASLRTLSERLTYLRNLEERKNEIKRSLEAQGKLTEELSSSVDKAETLAEVEDIYRPYKQKRRTRASVAREKGLELLAQLLFSQSAKLPSPEVLAQSYIDSDKGVQTVDEALAGAADIIAEDISDSAELRKKLRDLIYRIGFTVSCAASNEDSVYRIYYDFRQPVSKIHGYQILALNRGEKENYLKVSLEVDNELAMKTLFSHVIKCPSPAQDLIRTAAEDSYTRLLFPSLEREIRSELTDRANKGAIHNFSLNLKSLLMQPPIKGHVTIGLDPGYRMGCKVAVIDPTGKVLDTTIIYPTHGDRQKKEAIGTLAVLIKKYRADHIAIGNGTASRETEQMVCELIRDNPGVSYMIVNEAGASVYSVSELASREFPEFDVNLRSAVSIARRMQDPLAELVKIDPKAIGVGQYQHDMPQKRLDESLSAVVEDCVNAVGVDINTASPSLLKMVSGLNSTTAQNIVTYRNANGPFTSRKQILKVPKLGPKAFEQCVGFLRIPESKNIFDNTGVHPESYDAAEKLLSLCSLSRAELKDGTALLKDRVSELGEAKCAQYCGIGVPTLRDIVNELTAPGRDLRDELPAPLLQTGILDIKDLKVGMVITGTVRNVIDFGAFVDIGVHQDGLVHISEISDRFIRHPSEVLSVGDVVKVAVLSVDEKKSRISLSIRQAKNLS